MKLDIQTTTILLEYIQNPQINEDQRIIGSTILKNQIKKAYGVSIDSGFNNDKCRAILILITMIAEMREQMKQAKTPPSTSMSQQSSSCNNI